jgi:hypothetical protein
MKTNSFIAATLASLVLCMAASTAFAEPIGSAVRIVNKVTGSLDQQRHDLTVGDNVSQNEAIEVASDALGELKLRDDTKLALGPGSRLVLDKFGLQPRALDRRRRRQSRQGRLPLHYRALQQGQL